MHRPPTTTCSRSGCSAARPITHTNEHADKRARIIQHRSTPTYSMSTSFAERLVAWQKVHGRHDLPWQSSRDPYRIWVSEIMLQQTQVRAVIPYYLRFLARFPDLVALARAQEDDVLTLWAGPRLLRARAQFASRGANDRARLRWSFSVRDRRGACVAGHWPFHGAAICAFAYGARARNPRRQRKAGAGSTLRRGRLSGRAPCGGRALAPFGIAVACARGRGLHPGVDGPRRVRVRAHESAMRRVSAARLLRSPSRARTAALPEPRPARVLRERRTTMLILLSRGELLLEKRPAPGHLGRLVVLSGSG